MDKVKPTRLFPKINIKDEDKKLEEVLQLALKILSEKK